VGVFFLKHGVYTASFTAPRPFWQKCIRTCLIAADGGQMSVLSPRSVSSFRHCQPHDLLMTHLERQFGLRCSSGSAHGRTFKVVYGGSTSSVIYIPCLVSQSSVLRASLAFAYTLHLNTGSWHFGTNIIVLPGKTQKHRNNIFSLKCSSRTAFYPQCNNVLFSLKNKIFYAVMCLIVANIF